MKIVRNCKTCDWKNVCWEIPNDASEKCGEYLNREQNEIDRCVGKLTNCGWLAEHDKQVEDIAFNKAEMIVRLISNPDDERTNEILKILKGLRK